MKTVTRRCFAALLPVAMATVATSTAGPVEDPQILRLEVSSANFVLDVQNETETRTSEPSGDLIYDRRGLDISPALQVNLIGSVYHPYFMEFRLSAEAGVSWEDEKREQPGAPNPNESRQDTNPLQHYHARIIFFKRKPYSLTLLGDKDIVRRDNDFFTRLTIEREHYGASLRFAEGPWPWTLSWGYLTEDEVHTDYPRDFTETDMRFTTSNDRGRSGNTSFTYTFEDFLRHELGRLSYEGTRNAIALIDSEHFNRDRQRLLSDIRYSNVDASSAPSETLTALERLTTDHTDNLQSTLAYNLASRDSGDVESDNHEGRASLRHQLYESLTSMVDVDVRFTQQTDQDTTRYGGGYSEAYTKRLGDWGRLDAGIAMALHSEERTLDGSGGTVTVVDESHAPRDGTATFLNQPGADVDSIVVRNSTRTILYYRDLDYVVIERGSAVEIRRVFGGNIPNGSSVLVSYTANGQSSGAFSTFEDSYHVRLSLFDRLVSVYGRIAHIEHDGGESLVLHDIADKVVGTEVSWRCLRAGAEYQDFESNLTPFTATYLFQSLMFHPGSRSALSFDASQRRTTYSDTGEDLDTQSIIGRYQTRMTRALAFNAEGGLHTERRQGEAQDRDVVTARTGLTYWIGQTTLDLTYDYRDETYLGQSRRKELSTLRLKRAF